MTPRGRQALVITLRAVLLLQALGMGWQALEAGASPAELVWVGSALVGAILAAFGVRAGAGWTALHALSYDVTAALSQGPTALLEVPAHAVRFGVGLALVLLPVSDDDGGDEVSALWVLRVCAAATFAGHGVKAMMVAPSFVALLEAGLRPLGLDPTLAQASTLLRAIGLVDIVMAVAILLPTVPLVPLAYMAAWGLCTATTRILHGPPLGMDDALVRVANGGVPLSLFVGLVGARTANRA